jgi:hypothetical protein
VDLKSIDKLGRKKADRREFLKKAGKAAATVPAVALLLSANATPAEAFNRYGKCGRGHGRGRGRGHAYGRGHGRGNPKPNFSLGGQTGPRGIGYRHRNP